VRFAPRYGAGELTVASGFLDLITTPSSTPDWGRIVVRFVHAVPVLDNSNTSTGNCS
jgi:hypothetical protein